MFDLIDTAITGDQFLLALHDTLIMVAVSLGFGALIGVPLGIVLVVCRPGGIVANPVVHQALNPLINVLRSLPFIILLIVILPFTRLLVGTTIGTAGAIVPLIVFVAPYIAPSGGEKGLAKGNYPAYPGGSGRGRPGQPAGDRGDPGYRHRPAAV